MAAQADRSGSRGDRRRLSLLLRLGGLSGSNGESETPNRGEFEG